jgi:capsid protein
MKANLMGVSAAYGITYESLTNDYSNVNFSSARMAWLEMSRNVNKWQNMMRAQFLDRLAEWFFFGLELIGEDIDGAYIKWTYPRREMIDPTKEIPAMIKAARAGLTSIPRIHASLGENSDEILEEIAEFNEKMDDLGIISDADPRNTNMQGMKHKEERAEEETDNSEEEDS